MRKGSRTTSVPVQRSRVWETSETDWRNSAHAAGRGDASTRATGAGHHLRE